MGQLVRNVVVTGCTQGLGAIFSQELLLQGVHVVLTGRGDDAYDRMQVVIDDCERELEYRKENAMKQTGFEYSVLGVPERLSYEMRHLDISEPKQVADFTHSIQRSFANKPCILVNNAAEKHAGWTPDALQKSVRNNVFGTIELTESLLPILQPGSQVVHILCAECRPRLPGVLSPQIINAMHDLMRLDFDKFMKRAIIFPEFFPDEYMSSPARAEWAAYSYSKCLHYMYALKSAEKLERSDIRVNGFCPGAMGTRLGRDSSRNPMQATLDLMAVTLNDPHLSRKVRVEKAIGAPAGGVLNPTGDFYQGKNPISFADAINPRKNPVGITAFGQSTVPASFSNDDDWRIKYIREREGRSSVLGRVKSLFGM